MMHSSLFIPEQPLSLLDTLEAAGEECWVVGGCVRDSLMGKTPSDWDMTTSATPQRMQQIFSDRSLLLAGVEHGTVGVIWDGKVYEITTYRVESGSGDHRHPDSLHFSSKIEDDLARRDLTINAMAYHPQRGLLDCFGGQQDLHDRVIRSVGPALLRFEEDALRILRVLRFQAVLGFTVEEQTEQAIARKAPLLDCISVERIWSELQKLLLTIRKGVCSTALAGSRTCTTGSFGRWVRLCCALKRMRCVFCGYCAFRRCWALLWKNRLNRRLLEKRRCLIVSVSSASGRNCKSCWLHPLRTLPCRAGGRSGRWSCPSGRKRRGRIGWIPCRRMPSSG